MRDLLVPFHRMGFSIIDGPEIDNDFYNFEALNVLKDHPAREMQDTFFLASEWVLRTHTSNVQTHAMIERGVPLKIVCPGCVYRNEYDMTHVPSFRQIECLVVDKGIHMGHLRHTINELLNAAFGREVKIRFRSSYFPFTEPSAEVDVECQQCFGKGCRSCKHTGWSEIGGCGLVNRKVLESCHIDSSVYSGIAFGFGVDRIAKDRFAVADLRSLFDGNVSFLKSFGLV
jgi:phenylalanyl-tRNA synthetase alpha chain